jgi:hypothetical protein
MNHRHHLKPKHAGGEDAEDNLTPPIPVVRHAMFHWCEWKRTGNEFDRIAWLSLTGQIDTDGVKHEVLKESGKRRAKMTKERGELFFDPSWQSEQGKKGASKNLEVNWSSIVSRLRNNVKIQVQTGTHPFQGPNRSWDQKEVSKRSAQTQLAKGNHPFQGQNPNWDRSEAARKASQTQLLKGNHSSQTKDRGPNYKKVAENSARIQEWWQQNKTRKAANGRIVGPKICNQELGLELTSLQTLKTYLETLKNA